MSALGDKADMMRARARDDLFLRCDWSKFGNSVTQRNGLRKLIV